MDSTSSEDQDRYHFNRGMEFLLHGKKQIAFVCTTLAVFGLSVLLMGVQYWYGVSERQNLFAPLSKTIAVSTSVDTTEQVHQTDRPSESLCPEQYQAITQGSFFICIPDTIKLIRGETGKEYIFADGESLLTLSLDSHRLIPPDVCTSEEHAMVNGFTLTRYTERIDTIGGCGTLTGVITIFEGTTAPFPFVITYQMQGTTAENELNKEQFGVIESSFRELDTQQK